jgi:DNA-binding response OmpR family regulator
MRLLVIEDEAPMRTALVETLKAEGYRVLSAADGSAGLELACTEPFGFSPSPGPHAAS